MIAIRRRTLLLASLVFGLGSAAAILGYRASSAYARRLAAVTADYLAVRVSVIDGWILSETEAQPLLDQISAEAAARTESPAPAGSAAPPPARP